MRNVFEATDTRQKQAKKRSLCVINEHFELVFNTAAATQIVSQRSAKVTGDRHTVSPGNFIDLTSAFAIQRNSVK
ncbi:MAG: hypothetical protein A4S08_12910 [Proteobacteria bacterium SG_bin4]|nr:MAG: hypothetical protein A4S08_12910 [Proteobacteria bacterium SG_bin4]